VFDVGGGGGSGGNPGDGEAGCSKIDFLFVVDRSGSMEDEQANLTASFPEFISTIEAKTAADDYQLMVVDSDECDSSFGSGVGMSCDTAEDPKCCENVCATLPGGDCNDTPCGGCPAGPDACFHDLGAGRVHDENQQPCGIEGGARFMKQSQPGLDDKFACAATVGIRGSGNEMPMSAMVEAISPSTTGPGGCNEGFVRDDALLVITIITDEEDDHEQSFFFPFGSDGDPADWYQAVVDVKGKQRNAVVLALVGPPGANACPPLGDDSIEGAEVAHRIAGFAEMFDFGFVGPVCAASYQPFFQEAVDVIDQACDDFVPEG
jgi:hypothetical protein